MTNSAWHECIGDFSVAAQVSVMLFSMESIVCFLAPDRTPTFRRNGVALGLESLHPFGLPTSFLTGTGRVAGLTSPSAPFPNVPHGFLAYSKQHSNFDRRAWVNECVGSDFDLKDLDGLHFVEDRSWSCNIRWRMGRCHLLTFCCSRTL